MSVCFSLFGRNLTVSLWGFEPYVIYRGDTSAAFFAHDDVAGSDIDILNVISEHLGFGYVLRNEKFVDSVNNSSGFKIGIIGDVMR